MAGIRALAARAEFFLMAMSGKLENARDDRPESPSTAGWAASHLYWQGLDLLNEGRYFDAHEVLEDVWREIDGPDRRFVQGLIQVAVAFHHHSRGNLIGARSLLKRAGANLAPYSDLFGSVHTDLLRAAISAWQKALESGGPEPQPIRISRIVSGASPAQVLESPH